ncbi:hypothetical protein LUZ60_007444 [Juncus effusus]|nr:hypothetical protein LUZ60_007444 [Juncus effusus]
MAEVVLRSPSFSNDGSRSATHLRHDEEQRGEERKHQQHQQTNSSTSSTRRRIVLLTQQNEEQDWSFWALLFDLVRKSIVGCKTEGEEREGRGRMEIGWPTEVRHVAHVTFDRFHGFLGLPDEFEPEVPRRAPSASASVFGVSTESMQLSYDSRGNSVPTILLLLQRRLYQQSGLKAEGIFRINAENSQEELVRDQLNRGIVPDGIDVHCLAGLIKAWFRELPQGVLDSIPPEQVMACQTEDEARRVARCLPLTEAALLDWAINLMADVVQEESFNKMNARNIAMVFAPNMTQMADPLTALMYAVQVMNFLKMLILKTLKERQESNLDPASLPTLDPSDQNGHQNPKFPLDSLSSQQELNPKSEEISYLSEEPSLSEEKDLMIDQQIAVSDTPSVVIEGSSSGCNNASVVNLNLPRKNKALRSPSHRKSRKGKGQFEKLKEKSSIVSRLNSKNERIEAWR